MSGSSYARHVYSRCVVALDAGVSISWDLESMEHGQRHHEQEEARFRARLAAGTAAIEVICDRLEQAGHAFVPPRDARFEEAAQRGHSGRMEQCEVAIACTPPLADEALNALAAEIAGLIAPPVRAPETPPPPEAPRPAEPSPKKKPWWRFW